MNNEASDIEFADVTPDSETAGQMTKVIEQPAPTAPSTVTPMQLLQVATERGASLEELKQFMDLQERYDANEARKAYVVAMNAFKANPPTLIKNQHVKFSTSKGVTEYDHATLDQVSKTIAAALSKHGISHRWAVEQPDGGIIKVTCVLTHDMGHSESVPMQAGADQSGGKNSIQAIGSTITYLQRYTLLSATGMAVQGQDNDGYVPTDMISEEQLEILNTLADDVGADKAGLCKYFGIDSMAEIKISQLAVAHQMLERKRQQANKEKESENEDA